MLMMMIYKNQDLLIFYSCEKNIDSYITAGIFNHVEDSFPQFLQKETCKIGICFFSEEKKWFSSFFSKENCTTEILFCDLKRRKDTTTAGCLDSDAQVKQQEWMVLLL